MKPIAAIIPTQNRPALLAEALRSLGSQTLPPAEIIVVDDGSTPPVNPEALGAKYGPTVRVIRNEAALGLAFSRNRGVETAMSEYVVHLDDDDLFSPNALSEAYISLSNDPQLDLVFLGTEGFGSRADHFNRVQQEAVARVKDLGKGQEVAPSLVYFGYELMGALLHTVPIAFQRVMLRRERWNAISTLRWRAYRLDPEVPDDEAAKRCLAGPLRDSEWALYASMICRKTALIDRPLYLQRCDGQGYSSQPANQERHMLQSLLIKTRLYHASLSLSELSDWKQPIRESLAAAQFDTAYAYFKRGQRHLSWQHLRAAIVLHPHLSYAKFAARMLLPQQENNKVNIGKNLLRKIGEHHVKRRS